MIASELSKGGVLSTKRIYLLTEICTFYRTYHTRFTCVEREMVYFSICGAVFGKTASASDRIP